MRDSYVADVGDFGKYALLNALAGNDLRLGVPSAALTNRAGS